MKSHYSYIDTPALLIDREILELNIDNMQKKADLHGIKLRPHVKTHRMPELALMQVAAGASGITVAKVGEAEVMAEAGITDIFIANEIIGNSKLERIKSLCKKARVIVGIDSLIGIRQIAEVFYKSNSQLEVRIEIEVGEERSGIIKEEDFRALLSELKKHDCIKLEGIFSHEGHTYFAKSAMECVEMSQESQRRTLKFAEIAEGSGFELETVSIGATPSLLHTGILKGINEIRPGTYILMDDSQAKVIGNYERCAASILTTVISKPTEERLITDSGAKALTAQRRMVGITANAGFGHIKGTEDKFVTDVYDEHGIIYDQELRVLLEIGDKIEIIPNHICPTCNLYDKAYLVSKGQVVKEIPILCRGKSQ